MVTSHLFWNETTIVRSVPSAVNFQFWVGQNKRFLFRREITVSEINGRGGIISTRAWTSEKECVRDTAQVSVNLTRKTSALLIRGRSEMISSTFQWLCGFCLAGKTKMMVMKFGSSRSLKRLENWSILKPRWLRLFCVNRNPNFAEICLKSALTLISYATRST